MTARPRDLAAILAALGLLSLPATASAATSFDDFAQPAPLTAQTFTGSNVGATGESNEPDHAQASLRAGCTGPTNPDTGCLTSVWGKVDVGARRRGHRRHLWQRLSTRRWRSIRARRSMR